MSVWVECEVQGARVEKREYLYHTANQGLLNFCRLGQKEKLILPIIKPTVPLHKSIKVEFSQFMAIKKEQFIIL